MTAGDDDTGRDGEAEELSALEKAVAAMPLRGIGPAFMGGRIADIAVHPARRSTWYAAVASGGVWKTTNAGTTWTPIFDDQPSYSIGCVTLDPNHPEVVWVGTGENVSGRHVAWGSGVYRSRNGGATWEATGLDRSEHIADILVDPRDSDVVYVAAEGPLWSSGGERGLFKTTDGGSTWSAALELDEHTGVSSVAFAPGDPDTIYAATYQRRRHVATFLGGGPGSGIHVSNDAGATWDRITEGLPKSDMGKIGLAVTPAAPDLVYATVEANDDDKGFYRSCDRGRSWEKRCDYISGGTGPHYYQEIFASPVDADLVYQVDVFLQVTRDGGASFGNLESGRQKHSDNHVVWIDPDDGRHLLVGTDAGLYETFDQGETFRHFPNLPVSQFYRVAVDNSEPFYNVLGGAQDLGTLFGPSRTRHVDGVRNQDWWVPLGADGYHVAFDPDDPDTFYLEWQVGNVMRFDRRTMELHDIQPQPGPDDPPERWNWDAPIVVSAHDSQRIYVASQRVWRSEDRGDSWTPISGDLTRDVNRYELESMDRTWSVDSLYDHMAMSLYSTISHVSESPVVDGVVYAGTDDGLVQVTEDGGASWREAGPPPGLPDAAFINDVTASRGDADTVFLAADDHKNGDYSPYVYVSHDRGRSWEPIRGNLPDGTTVWAIEQDHVNPRLLFLGTEFGLRVSVDAGATWTRLSKDVPTIAFRELAVHRRDDDLIGASFGRGFYVLDDYSALRTVDDDAVAAPASLFSIRDAWWYVPYEPGQAAGQPTLGSSAFRAANPPFGATFTYHLAEDVTSSKKQRHAEETTKRKADEPIPFPGWDTLWGEHIQADPRVLFVIRDAAGDAVRTIEAGTKKGLHRTAWDLRREAAQPVVLDKPEFEPPWASPPKGPLVEPGTYSAELVVVRDGAIESLAGPEQFEVKPIPAISSDDDSATFRRDTLALARQVAGAAKSVEQTRRRVRHVRETMVRTAGADAELFARLDDIAARNENLGRALTGDPVRTKLSEADTPSIAGLVDRVTSHHWDTTRGPTATQRTSVERATSSFEAAATDLASVRSDLDDLVSALDALGATWTEGS